MPHSNNLCYEFGPFRLNVNQRVLTRDGDLISLGPKATEILLLLLRNAGELVGKEEMLRAVWPDSFVEEANLSQNIFTLRRAFGDARSDARYIETVTGRGYRFVGSVKSIEIAALASHAVGGVQKVDAKLDGPTILAVLPFVNATGNDSLEYLADGVSDNIINSLSQISKLRVMSRSAVFRFKGTEVDPKFIVAELGVDAMLLGKVISRPSGLMINAELVDVATGWQLWGESFDCESQNLLEIQDEIARQISATLRLKLTGEEEKRITARYTESSSAYQQYIEGRYHWSHYTRAGIEKAIGHFRNAIELDPNYALAYAGIVDCYLRLATNYLPPENDAPVESEQNDRGTSMSSEDEVSEAPRTSDPKVKLRYEWDWKGAERELRRANELKADYPAAHQWNAAYEFAVKLLQESSAGNSSARSWSKVDSLGSHVSLRAILSPNEEAQVLCTVAREQIEVGNYDAACLVLRKWWIPNEWPRLEELNLPSAADLLFTAGSLTGCLSSTGLFEQGQKHAEALISGSIGLFEHLGLKRRCAEGIIELAHCYYRQGAFALARSTLVRALNELSSADTELRSICLIRLAVTERHAGHLYDSLARLNEARESVERSGALVTGRFHHELSTTLKDLALAESQINYSEPVIKGFQQAIYEFEAIGHHRYAAVVENNFGFLLLSLKEFDKAEKHLLRARRFLEAFADRIRAAQVDDSLARLYMATDKLELAEKAACAAVSSLENSDEEALLAESLTTRGLVLCRLGRTREARGVLEGAHRIAERCGDTEGAGRALLTVIEEIFHELGKEERLELAVRLRKLLGKSQQASTLKRLEICLERIASEVKK